MSVFPISPPGTLLALSSLGDTTVTSAAELDRLLDELDALARTHHGAGESVELRVDDDEVLCVDLEPKDLGWAVRYDNSRTEHYTSTLNGSGDTEPIECRWFGNWVATQAQCFIDPAAARRVAQQFLAERTLADDVTWYAGD